MVAKEIEGDGLVKRALPERRNDLLKTENTPEHSELTSLRRLGQTELSVRPDQIGKNNSTKRENLGLFDYAHLRAPLPDNLQGSEIFAPHQNQSPPTSYFLMRRSSDGFISATGMFKAAFPWAKHAEEEVEKIYIKSLTSTAQNEIAGNIWVDEHFAIELAEEYGLIPWIHALLDPKPIHPTSNDAKAKSISPPPKFKFTAGDKAHFRQPNGTPARDVRASTPKSRGRPRAGSPEKKAGSPQKTGKKSRSTKATKEADERNAREASASLQSALDNAASKAEEVESTHESVRIHVESKLETKGDITTETTNVNFEMPKGVPELPLPESPEQMIEKAKAIVEEARRMDGEEGPSRSKRKAEQLDEELDGEGDADSQPAKRAKLLQQEVRREKVRNRALIGVAATLFVGAAIPFLTG